MREQIDMGHVERDTDSGMGSKGWGRVICSLREEHRA